MHYEKTSNDGWPYYNETISVVSDNFCSEFIFDYEINIKREFRNPENLINAGIWAKKYCNGRWLIGYNVSGFSSEEDAILFKLTWG